MAFLLACLQVIPATFFILANVASDDETTILKIMFDFFVNVLLSQPISTFGFILSNLAFDEVCSSEDFPAWGRRWIFPISGLLVLIAADVLGFMLLGNRVDAAMVVTACIIMLLIPVLLRKFGSKSRSNRP